MALVDWIAFGVAAVSVGGGFVILGLRAFDTWRAFRSLRRTVGRGLGDLTRRVAGTESRIAHLGDNATKLERAGSGLTRSLASAAVLAAAAGDARASLGVIRALIPRK
jgi:hypothetical protein